MGARVQKERYVGFQRSATAVRVTPTVRRRWANNRNYPYNHWSGSGFRVVVAERL